MFEQSNTHRPSRRNLLTSCLIACLALPAVAGSAPAPQGVPWTLDRANAWYPLRPVVAAPEISIGRFVPAKKGRPEGSATRPAKPLLTCDEAGLRDAIANASSGDALDLTACSEITLTTGEIHVIVDDLTLNGPGSGQLAIKGGASAGHFNRIFDHTGVGTLSINGLTLSDAHYVGSNTADGGCIYSSGSVELSDAVVTGCIVEAPANSNTYALGGGIHAFGDVTVNGGAITGNAVISAQNAAYGGGIFARGNVHAYYTTIANNLAIAPAPTGYSEGGGIAMLGAGDFLIAATTLFGNAAESGGAVLVNTTGTSNVVNSTISQNFASSYVGGGIFIPGVTVTESTITANTAGYASFGVGLYVQQTLNAQGSIIANNLGGSGTVMLDAFAPVITGSGDLITSATSPLPADTITACPRLTPLQDNGGPTLTHKLIAGSPAIDRSDAFGFGLAFDQRGLPRLFGPFADIGAVEWQGELDDDIFRSAFEIQCD